MKNEWIDKSPYTAYKGKTKNVDGFYLNKNELADIIGKEVHSERLKLVRDVFIFFRFTGLAYVDVLKLKQDNMKKGIDGERWIFTNRQKTKTRSSVPLFPTAIEIIDRYAINKVCINKALLLPVPSSQKMNKYLREIEDLCRIDKKLVSPYCTP